MVHERSPPLAGTAAGAAIARTPVARPTLYLQSSGRIKPCRRCDFCADIWRPWAGEALGHVENLKASSGILMVNELAGLNIAEVVSELAGPSRLRSHPRERAPAVSAVASTARPPAITMTLSSAPNERL